MGKLLGIEILLMAATGLFSMTVIPWILGHPPAGRLLLVGFLMAMSFVALYALFNLAGRRLAPRTRALIGLLAFAGAFWGPLLNAAGLLPDLPLRLAYVDLAPPLAGLLLTAVAGIRAVPGERGKAAAGALYAYALPSLGLLWLLVPLVRINLTAQLIAVQAGAFYLFLRGLFRIFLPTAAEGNPDAPPLVYRPVPDRIVGLVEGTTRRRARPFATRADGSLDESAISILCGPEDLPALSARLREALAEEPFAVEAGVEAGRQIELVIRPATAGEPAQT
ncbi:MAG: hypothetical protein ACOY93_05345 [Bacillota bacterium]